MRSIILLTFVLYFPALLADNALKIGIPPYIPPFVMNLDNKSEFVGFDIALMDEICRRLNHKCQYYPMNFKEIFAAVGNNVIDLGVGNITITDEREEHYQFSLPYMESYGQYVSLKKYNYSDYPQLKGKTIGIHLTYLYEPLIFTDFGDDIKIKYYEELEGLVGGLSNGEVDAAMMDAAVAESLYANDENIALVGDKIPYGLGYGIVASQDDKEITTRINEILLTMESDGTYMKIYNTYFGNMNY